jgi:hypothetical protein
MGKFYYDSASYGSEELEFVAKMIGRSERYKRGGRGMLGGGSNRASSEAAELKAGISRIIGFSTDHPFFRPVSSETDESSAEHPIWRSVTENLDAINMVSSFDAEDRAKIRGGNAKELFKFWD